MMALTIAFRDGQEVGYVNKQQAGCWRVVVASNGSSIMTFTHTKQEARRELLKMLTDRIQ